MRFETAFARLICNICITLGRFDWYRSLWLRHVKMTFSPVTGESCNLTRWIVCELLNMELTRSESKNFRWYCTSSRVISVAVMAANCLFMTIDEQANAKWCKQKQTTAIGRSVANEHSKQYRILLIVINTFKHNPLDVMYDRISWLLAWNPILERMVFGLNIKLHFLMCVIVSVILKYGISGIITTWLEVHCFK